MRSVRFYFLTFEIATEFVQLSVVYFITAKHRVPNGEERAVVANIVWVMVDVVAEVRREW